MSKNNFCIDPKKLDQHDMYPFYWTSSERGFYIKDDFNFKLNAVEMYRSGHWIETPDGIVQKNFRKRIVKWSTIADIYLIDFLRHPTTNKEHSAEDRFHLVACLIAGESQKSVAISAGIDSGLLSNRIQKFKIYGYEGLNLKKVGKAKEVRLCAIK